MKIRMIAGQSGLKLGASVLLVAVGLVTASTSFAEEESGLAPRAPYDDTPVVKLNQQLDDFSVANDLQEADANGDQQLAKELKAQTESLKQDIKNMQRQLAQVKKNEAQAKVSARAAIAKAEDVHRKNEAERRRLAAVEKQKQESERERIAAEIKLHVAQGETAELASASKPK